VKTASKLLSAAFAIAAVASVAMPFAKPAEAASGYDLKPEIHMISGTGNGQWFIHSYVRNVGGTKSSVYVQRKFCGYLPDNGSLVEWFPIAEAPADANKIWQPVEADQQTGMDYFQCLNRNGRHPVAVRVDLVTSGEANTANNSARRFTHKLDVNAPGT
jgi:hypothetical protein